MKSLKSRLKKHEVTLNTSDWSKYDDRLMKAVEKGDADKVTSVLAKRGIVCTKLDVEGRSAFHVAAAKGDVPCINAMLSHGVDVMAIDAAGRSVLHLAAQHGQPLCLQRLLQQNCPVDSVDLHGRSALHNAVVAGCPACVKLLLDHEAAVNIKDGDGQTPLMLATQKCHPEICRLLLERGADINSRDKQNRTALMMGCETGCKDAVEVLLNRGADVTLTDDFGHKSLYYAQLSKDPELLALARAAMEKKVKAREPSTKSQQVTQVPELSQKIDQRHFHTETQTAQSQKEQRIVKELQIENEDLKGKLKKHQQDQRLFLERLSGLQKQLNQECKAVGDLQNERQQLKNLLLARDREQEDNMKVLESVRAKLRTYESGHFYEQMAASIPMVKVKEEMAVKQTNFPATESQHPSKLAVGSSEVIAPFQSTPEVNESLRKDLEMTRKRFELARKEVNNLQLELLNRNKHCEVLNDECKRVKQESEEQIRQLEDALSEVQKRMFESEGKVKLLQAHVNALKDHLSKQGPAGNNRAVDELKTQLKDVKSKHEEALSEVERLQNQIKLGVLSIQESGEVKQVDRYKEEVREMKQALTMSEQKNQEAERKIIGMENELKSMEKKISQFVPAEEFENMRNSFISGLEEKEKQVVEANDKYNSAQKEVVQLQKELERERARAAACVKMEQYQSLKSSFDSQGEKVSDITQKQQKLQKENEAIQQENARIKSELEGLKHKIQVEYVPLKTHDSLKSSMNQTVQDLNKQVSKVSQRYKEALKESEKLKVEKNTIRDNLNHVQTQYVSPEKHKKEITTLNSIVSKSKTELEELNQKYSLAQRQTENVLKEIAALKDSLKSQYVPLEKHEELKKVLNAASEKAAHELSLATKQCSEVQSEMARSEQEKNQLKEQLVILQDRMQEEYIPLQQHEELKTTLNSRTEEQQKKVDEALSKYKEAQEETAELRKEKQNLANELHILQESLSSQYVPVENYEQKQNEFNISLKEVMNQLTEKTQQCSAFQEEAKKYKKETEELKKTVGHLEENLEKHYVSKDIYEEMESKFVNGMGEKDEHVEKVMRKCADVELQSERSQKENAKLQSDIQALKESIQLKYIPVEEFEAMKTSLNNRVLELQKEKEKMKTSCAQEQQKVETLLLQLDDQKKSSLPLLEHTEWKEKMDTDIARLKNQLNEREEELRGKVTEISKLQADAEALSRTITELKTKEANDLSKHETVKSTLEAQVISLNKDLAELKEKEDQMCTEILRAKEKELSAKDEKETFQSRSFSFEQEIKELKNKYDDSMATICDLQKSIQESAKQIEAKDNKITELLNDVERLKQALNGLSQLSYSATNPKRPSQQMEALQVQIKDLQQQLADADRQHREVIAIYRTHLLNAAQGHMDEDVQAALLQIIRMRQEFVC
ncbi:uveal autoantigen with coiled-coil domains and ankyrin repeats-like isoform X2 [Hemiscyllium ocellatum]|uniref:uveal autoantigen with coiled-coil domains and ankyrin repeats-like isoform X2 n=1 Tax=Hemiscyllium ocellatum TaxID=170820 RepID=UPI0029671143|nr:uveal autoantigen with coiled-coil domains and ankyrin repeats-like isoform X2 [Hemiscyllium ocellatum]